jgi:hypothetical protein
MNRTRTPVGRWAVGAVLVALGLTGCGGHDEDAKQAAEDFYGAVAASDGAAACRLLAPSTVTELEQTAGMPCEQAILEEGIPDAQDARDVEVYGTAAIVRYGAETAFLGKFGDGWRIVAAACAPLVGDEPHDCRVTGG